MTRWDGLLFLFNIPFLIVLFVPDDTHTVKTIIAAIIAVVGITATTIASHTQRTSYTPWAQRVWKVVPRNDVKQNSTERKKPFFKPVGPYQGQKYDALRDFYKISVQPEINRLTTELELIKDPTQKKEKESQKKMLEKNTDWNDTQWEKFCDWHDGKYTSNDDAINEMMAVKTKRSTASKDPIIIFGVIYAFIAGWAITNAVLTFSNVMDAEPGWHDHNFLNFAYQLLTFQTKDMVPYDNLLVFLSFFPLAIIFYHLGAIFLTSKASSLITAGERGKILVNFFIILSSGILLYLMSDRAAFSGSVSNSVHVDNAGPFTSFVILLLGINIVWVFLFKYLDAKDDKHDYPIYMEWLHMYIFVLIFCIVFLLSGAFAVPNPLPYLCMFSVFVSMTTCSYIFAWQKIWVGFQGTD